MRERLLWISLFAVAMAVLEAVVVAYLRGLLSITRQHVTLDSYITMEIAREASTLVMLVAVGWLSGRHWRERLAFMAFTFGLWDIWYYIWLKLFIAWPNSLFDWDILFLIPFRWWGPVLAPVLIATLLCVTAVLFLLKMEQNEKAGETRLGTGQVTAAFAGANLALYLFMADSFHAWLRQQADWHTIRPTPFNWPLFLLALVLMSAPAGQIIWQLLAVGRQLGHQRTRITRMNE
jgi:hypothetical protein